MGKTFSTGLLTNGIWQDSSNNIGIGGAANASYKLAVTGASLFSSTLTADGAYLTNGNPLRVYNTGNGDYGNLTFATATGFTFDKKGKFTDEVNVSGNNKYIFQGSGATTGYQGFILQNTGTNINIGVSPSNGGFWGTGEPGTYYATIGTSNATALGFATNSIPRAYINSSGTFAIGALGRTWQSLYRALEIGNGWGIMAQNANSDGYICSNAYYDGAWKVSAQNGPNPTVLRVYDGYVFQVGTSGAVGATTTLTDFMNIANTGNVSINQSPTPANVKFKIRTNDQSTSYYSFLIDNAIYDTFWVRNDGLVNITARKLAEVVTITNGRNASGDYALVTAMGANTNNTGSYHIICSTGGADKFYVYGNGNVVNANNSYGPLSDIKLKENITDATPKLDKLMQVRIVNYNLINNPELKQIGVIAQELENVFPGLVDEQIDRDREGNDLGTTTKSVKMSVFVPMLIKAMQEQQEIINQLSTKVTALENK